MKDLFVNRHIGNNPKDKKEMLQAVGVTSLDQLIDETVPSDIRLSDPLDLPAALTEWEYLKHIGSLEKENQCFDNYIGYGYYGTITPAVIRRNVFENPGWYTQYTPYQAEIAQGRLEALLNFQTMVSDLTGMPIANASLLDDATAAAEGMAMFHALKNKRKQTAPNFFVDEHCFSQIKDVLLTRAEPLNINLIVGDYQTATLDETYFGAIVQFPNSKGGVVDYTEFAQNLTEKGIYLTVIADLMSLTLLTPPGEWGADCVVGNTQRLGVPMGYGGPHAAYFATKEEFKRLIPGRIIGVSVDRMNQPALRMALQTREQHIRREKATSNICTAQALLAIMAGMYAVYHGRDGLKAIATEMHEKTKRLAQGLNGLGYALAYHQFFDTLSISSDQLDGIKAAAEDQEINLGFFDGMVHISIDETTSEEAVEQLIDLFKKVSESHQPKNGNALIDYVLEKSHLRTSDFLMNGVFWKYRSETQLMRYIKGLENKDLSLTHSMIPLGSCTMKLNAAVQLEPLTWKGFSTIHPFTPTEQVPGYKKMIQSLEGYLAVITGLDATSLQPNSGAQGEYAGLMVIRAYHKSRGEDQRDVVLIPASAHGTNPASAIMAGGKVVVVKCDNYGNIDKDDLIEKTQQYKDVLSALMITYPSTHGVFEHHIKEIISIVHDHGGQVYMDGANMNAQVGLTSPGAIGADVCHLNLHKTFAIPHGGGGPGMGPICVEKHLTPFLPGNPNIKVNDSNQKITAISAAPWGSASILLISYAYIRLLGFRGLTISTRYAILNANYIKARLQEHYEVLYTGKENGHVAHELILDFRPFKHSLKIEVEDIAKRLIDYGFHAPTVSFPVAGTLMIEPTESEDKLEIDRFCDALIHIKGEINELAKGETSIEDCALKNAPHTLEEVTADEWNHAYSRSTAAYPVSSLRTNKFWASVSRVNNSFGDRNLICTCPPMEEYMAQGEE